MSIMDVDLANEKLDYEVIYKKKFDEINEQLDELRYKVNAQRIDFNNLEVRLNEIISKVDFVMHEQNKILEALDILRIHLNDMLPDEAPKIYLDFN